MIITICFPMILLCFSYDLARGGFTVKLSVCLSKPLATNFETVHQGPVFRKKTLPRRRRTHQLLQNVPRCVCMPPSIFLAATLLEDRTLCAGKVGHRINNDRCRSQSDSRAPQRQLPTQTHEVN